MIKAVLFSILIMFLISAASGNCNDNQIDINTAPLQELDSLNGIGAIKAQQIIDSRPFSSVDGLIEVTGIGNATLSKIKSQGLACVGKEEIQSTDPESSVQTTSDAVKNTEEIKPETITLTPISLNSKNIKSGDNKEFSGKNLALYGIVAFCAVFGTLFLLKFVRRKKQNEFR